MRKSNQVVDNEIEFEVAPFTSPELQELRIENERQAKMIILQQQEIHRLQQSVDALKEENNKLKRTSIKNMSKRCTRQQEAIKTKDEQIKTLQRDAKRRRVELTLPEPATVADDILLELINRRSLPKNHPYSDRLKEFAFNAHYISPKGYDFFRGKLANFLPSQSNFSRWIKHVVVGPGTNMNMYANYIVEHVLFHFIITIISHRHRSSESGFGRHPKTVY